MDSDPLPGARPLWKVSPHIGPQDLMSGEGLGNLPLCPNVKIASLLFPDLSPKRGWGFEFDRGRRMPPATFCSSVPHDWLRRNPWLGTNGITSIRRSITRWCVPSYSTCRPNPQRPERDPTADRRSGWKIFSRRSRAFGISPSFTTPCPAAMRSRPVRTMAGVPYQKARSFEVKKTSRYHFDFAPYLPDSLFTVGDARASQDREESRCIRTSIGAT